MKISLKNYIKLNQRVLHYEMQKIVLINSEFECSTVKTQQVQQVLGPKTASKSKQSQGALSHVAYLMYARSSEHYYSLLAIRAVLL